MFSGSTMMFGDTQASQTLIMGSGADAKRPRQEEKTTVLPVTVRGIERALATRGDMEVSFWGTEPGMLILVAVVESISQEGAAVEFVLNDSTGRIRARHYASDLDSKLDCVETGRYVQVAGQFRASPAPHISVTNARAVRCADEISYHMIESAHGALRLQRGSVEPATATPQKAVAGTMSAEVTPPKIVLPVTVASSTPIPATSVHEPVPLKSALEGVALRSAALNFLRQSGEGREEGVPFAEISVHFLPASEAVVRDVLAQLISDGDVFNTIDEDHFAVI